MTSAEARHGAGPPERADRRTVFGAVADPLLFWSGDAFASQAVVLPLFVQHLAASPLAVGLVPALWGVGFSVPQLVAAAYAQRRPYKLRPALLLFGIQRASLLALAILTLAIGQTQPSLLLVCFFVLYGIGAAGNGAGIPFYHDVLARVLPVRIRGRVKALALGIAGVVGTLGGLAARDLLAWLPFPDGFALCFAIAAGLGISSLICAGLIREPPSPVAVATPGLLHHLRQLPRVLHTDHNFAWYLASRAIFALGTAAATFLAPYAVAEFALPEAEIGTLIAVYTAGSTAATALWGWLADRRGHKLSVQLGSLALVIGLALAVVAPVPAVAYAALALAGAANASYWVSGLSVVLEFGPPAERPTYIGLASAVVAPATIIAPVLAGGLAAVAGYRGLFAAALLPAAIGWLIIARRVREPRDAAPHAPVFAVSSIAEPEL